MLLGLSALLEALLERQAPRVLLARSDLLGRLVQWVLVLWDPPGQLALLELLERQAPRVLPA